MRIAFLCRSLPFHRQGGMEWHAWDLLRGLARRGHHLRVLTTPLSASARREFEQHRIEGVELVELGASRAGLYSTRYLRDVAGWVAAQSRQRSIDLVHAQGFSAFFLFRKSLGPIPLVITIHGTLWSETLLDYRTRRFVPVKGVLASLWRYRHRFAAMPLYAAMLRRADALIADSRFTREELLSGNPTIKPRIHVVPLGIDPGRFPAGAPDVEENNMHEAESSCPSDAPRLLALGRLEPEKGIQVALHALARCREKNWTLTIAGEGPARPGLERLVAEMGLSRCVVFTGRIGQEHIARLYAQADLFLNPDLTQPAFGLVVLEAMLQGTPVLASRGGAMPEVVGEHGGWLVEAGDVAAWSARLDALLSDPAALRDARFREAVRADALRRFSLDGMIEGVERVYRIVVGIDRPSRVRQT